MLQSLKHDLEHKLQSAFDTAKIVDVFDTLLNLVGQLTERVEYLEQDVFPMKDTMSSRLLESREKEAQMKLLLEYATDKFNAASQNKSNEDNVVDVSALNGDEGGRIVGESLEEINGEEDKQRAITVDGKDLMANEG